MSAYQSSVVGLAYEARGDYIRQNVTLGDALSLKADPDNRYDPDAVAVFHQWQKIGFVPAGSRWLAEALASGLVVEVVAGQLEYDEFAIPVVLPIDVALKDEPVQAEMVRSSSPASHRQASSVQKVPATNRLGIIVSLLVVIIVIIYIAMPYVISVMDNIISG